MNMLEPPPAADELAGEPLQQFGMRWCVALQAEVIGRSHQSFTEVMLPERFTITLASKTPAPCFGSTSHSATALRWKVDSNRRAEAPRPDIAADHARLKVRRENRSRLSPACYEHSHVPIDNDSMGSRCSSTTTKACCMRGPSEVLLRFGYSPLEALGVRTIFRRQPVLKLVLLNCILSSYCL